MESIVYVSSAVIAVLAVASFVLAYFTYQLHRNLASPRLIVFPGLIDEGYKESANTVVIQNVGQHPALNVNVDINLEKWSDGRIVASNWDKWDGFGDTIEVLQSQEQREYELPASRDTCVVTVKVMASNCRRASHEWAVGTDPGALRKVMRGKPFGKPKIVFGADSMKELNENEQYSSDENME